VNYWNFGEILVNVGKENVAILQNTGHKMTYLKFHLIPTEHLLGHFTDLKKTRSFFLSHFPLLSGGIGSNLHPVDGSHDPSAVAPEPNFL
jgi:hypothetical protein